MKRGYSVIDAPASLGLGSKTGVESAPAFYRKNGILNLSRTSYVGVVQSQRPSSFQRSEDGMINSNLVRQYSLDLAEIVEQELSRGKKPIVLGVIARF